MLSETGFDGKLSRYTYNPAGELVQENRYHHQNHQQLLQTTVYHRDRLGRIIQKDSHWNDNARSESSRYFYDKLSRLTRAHNAHSEIRFSYNSEGLLAKEQFHLLKEPIRYDVIQRNNYLHSQTTEYQYDVLGNRTQTRLSTGDVLNYLYYGSGHLHHINLNGETLTDIERDNLHRPIVRSAGQLNTQFQFDPMGRLKQQISQLAQYDSSNQSALIGRQYHYDATGNLIRTDDQRNGNIDYAYDSLGRILQAADERFAFDPAHNISDDAQIIKGNRLAEYNGVRYRYDGLGNLTERHSYTESQFYRYDADNQLIEARIEKANSPTQYWQYHYDPFGRRISKTNAKTQQSTLFVWEGSRLLQELRQDKVYTYVYTEQNSYEPLAQIETFRQPEKLNTPIIRYFHTDQIGIPREMTDEAGKIIWRGQYSAWGKLTEEEKINPHIHQPVRLQNQYADEETGLHYNFFRYYDAHCGRFTQQDPIGLAGGENLYAFAPNVQQWVDTLGLAGEDILVNGAKATLAWIATDTAIPEPTDMALPKWIGYGIAGTMAAGVIYMSSSNSKTQSQTETKINTATCSGSKCNNNNSCKVKYPNVPLCDDLARQGYIFNSLNQLFNHYRMQARKHSEAIATKGPCRGQGKHINLRSKDNGSIKVGTAASCNCCKDDAAGNAQLKTVFAKLN